MKKINLTMMLMALLTVFGGQAQVTTVPAPVQEDVTDLKIYFHADEGNRGLIGLDANTKVYAHTGLITDKSAHDSDWKYTIASWDKNIEKVQMVYEGPNLWSLYIGNLRDFYGVKDMTETIKKIAFVFRTSGGEKQGKTSSGGDIMVNVVDPGLQVMLSSNTKYEILDAQTGAITFTASSTSAANLSISVDGETIASKSGVKTLSANYTFTSVGEHTVKATATSGSTTVSDSSNYYYFNTPVASAYPGGTPKMGPVANPDGSVTFCVAAPEMSRMVLVGSWNNYLVSPEQQMFYTDVEVTQPVTNESGTFRFFWITIPGLALSNEPYIYFFKAQGTISVGNNTIIVNENTCDPYARLVLDPWNDKYIDTNVFPDIPDYPYGVVDGVPVAVFQNNINDYSWQCNDFRIPDKDNLIIYEMLFRDFTGTEGKAEGNGTVKGAIQKLDYLKKLGVNVIEMLPIYEFDGNDSWGYNPNFYFAPDKAYGTPDDYKEFIDLCHQNGIAVVLDMVFNQSSGQHPWCQMYGGTQFSPFFNYDMGGNGGAPHAYSVMNDWNQGYPLVQAQWKDVLKYWLTEYNIDGFRFDLVKGLGLNESYANSDPDATNKYNASRVAEMKYLNSVIQEIKPGAYCINENLAEPKEENEMAADGELNWAVVNYAACQFAMGYKSGSNMNRLYALDDQRAQWSTVSYLESHDEQRLAYKQDMWGVEGVQGNPVTSMQRLGSAAAQMIMTPGSHMIWMFSELGNAQNTKIDNDGNNTSPKIVNWNLLNEPNHKGLYDNYCQLIATRFNNPQFFGKEASFSINCNESNWEKGRTLFSYYQDEELLTFVNPNVKGSLVFTYNFKTQDNSAYQIMTQSYGSESFFNAATGSVTVPANCYVVIGSAGLTEVESIYAGDSQLGVEARNGEIIVLNSNSPVTVYSLDGKMIGRITEGNSLKVNKGLYIVRNSHDSKKVMVK